jgi:hypothetical protein
MMPNRAQLRMLTKDDPTQQQVTLQGPLAKTERRGEASGKKTRVYSAMQQARSQLSPK